VYVIDPCFLHLFFFLVVVDPNNWYKSEVHNDGQKKDQNWKIQWREFWFLEDANRRLLVPEWSLSSSWWKGL